MFLFHRRCNRHATSPALSGSPAKSTADHAPRLETLEPRILLSASLTGSPLDNLIARPWDGADPAGSLTPPAAISLDAGTTSRITGTVWHDLNANGTRDEDEAGLEGWRVFADANSDGVFQWGEPVAWADADGAYAIEDLVPGEHTIISDSLDGWSRTAGATTTVTIVDTDDVAVPAFGYLAAPSEIRGMHWDDRNANGTRDAGEPGLAGWTMFLDLDGDRELDPGERSTLTGPDGAYVFDHLAPGMHEVVAQIPDGWRQTSPFFTDQAGALELQLSNFDPGLWATSISADGQYVAIAAYDPQRDNPGFYMTDILLYDRRTNDLEVVTRAYDGGLSDGGSYGPSISGDGRYLVFTSRASNLTGDGVTSLRHRVYLYDRATDALTEISGFEDDGAAPLGGYAPRISADGTTIVYEGSVAIDGQTAWGLVAYDRVSGTRRLISFAPDGSAADDAVLKLSVSADGRYATGLVWASNLLDPDGTDNADGYYRFDLLTGARQRLLATTTVMSYATLSHDGQWLTIGTDDTLEPDGPDNDPDGQADVFLLHIPTSTLTHLSPDSLAGQEQLAVHSSSLADWTVFDSFEGEGSPGTSLMLHSRRTGAFTELVVLPKAAHYEVKPLLSADGRFVVYNDTSDFSSQMLNIIPNPHAPTLGVRQVMLAAGEIEEGIDFGVQSLSASPQLMGDFNGDGRVDAGDVDAMVLAMTRPASYAATHTDVDLAAADLDGDGVVTTQDINPMVDLLAPLLEPPAAGTSLAHGDRPTFYEPMAQVDLLTMTTGR